MAIDLKQWKPVADGIYSLFGETCEVVIHDLTQPEQSVIYIQGNLTNRKIGDGVTNLVIDELKKDNSDIADYIIADMEAINGQSIKSLSIFVKKENIVEGCLCILIDMTFMKLMMKYFDRFINKVSTSTIEKDDNAKDDNVMDITTQLINKALIELPVTVDFMQKEDKLKVVSKLDKQNIFLMKGAVDLLANKLQVSKYTIYNYLDEVRANEMQKDG